MRWKSAISALAALAVITGGCRQSPPPEKSAPEPASLTKRPFGKTAAGEAVDVYTLRNANGLETEITNYGGIVVSLKAPDRKGQMADVVLGFATLDGYLGTHPYFGAIIGRYGNRIAKGRFKLDGKEYRLAVNNGANHLHGGIKGFDKVVWHAQEMPGPEPALELHYVSKDGEEGYPGKLNVAVRYTLTNANELKIGYTAAADKATVVNVTNHSYFNLKGQGEGDILGHEVMIAANRFTPVDEGLIPTGELRPVAGTPFDFTNPAAIGARIGAKDQQLQFGNGYDHNYVLNTSGSLALAARVKEPVSGRVLEVWTTEPGVQFYTGNFLDGKITGKGGKVYRQRYGFCLETQHFPDSPNKPAFPSVVLRPGAEYKTTTVYKFLAE
jgi:aldose 1-epimerase